MRRNSAVRSRLVNGRPFLRSSAFKDEACSRAIRPRSARTSRADRRRLLRPPRREAVLPPPRRPRRELATCLPPRLERALCELPDDFRCLAKLGTANEKVI